MNLTYNESTVCGSKAPRKVLDREKNMQVEKGLNSDKHALSYLPLMSWYSFDIEHIGLRMKLFKVTFFSPKNHLLY